MSTDIAPPGTVPRNGSLGTAARRSLKILAPFVRRHRGRLLWGGATALAVVALRLALPIPVRSWLDRLLATPPEFAGGLSLAAAFLLIALGLGLANLLARLAFARFAIEVVAGLRAAAFEAVPRAGTVPVIGSGEAVARLIGDTARIKAAVKGFLVHVVTHGLFVLGMTLVLFWILPALGWVLIAGGAALGLVTAAGAESIRRRAARYRGREGQLAEAIRDVWDEGPRRVGLLGHNRASGEHEAVITRTQELVTWAAHAVFGLVLVGFVTVGGAAVQGGRLAGADLVLIALYAMMVRTPIVQLARQGARTGKIFACVERVGALVRLPSTVALPRRLARLELKAAAVRGRARRLGPLDVEIEAGQHVAVVGRAGAGKTTFLELLAGLVRPASGEVLWDGAPHPGPAVLGPGRRLAGLLAEQPVWPRMSLRESLFLPQDAAAESLPRFVAEVLRASGTKRLAGRLSRGLGAKLASADLSSRERRALGLVRALLADGALVLLDEPARDLGRRRAERLLAAVHDATRERTLVAALHRPLALALFDRVIELRGGRVVWDGDPAAWRAARAQRSLRIAEAS